MPCVRSKGTASLARLPTRRRPGEAARLLVGQLDHVLGPAHDGDAGGGFLEQRGQAMALEVERAHEPLALLDRVLQLGDVEPDQDGASLFRAEFGELHRREQDVPATAIDAWDVVELARHRLAGAERPHHGPRVEGHGLSRGRRDQLVVLFVLLHAVRTGRTCLEDPARGRVRERHAPGRVHDPHADGELVEDRGEAPPLAIGGVERRSRGGFGLALQRDVAGDRERGVAPFEREGQRELLERHLGARVRDVRALHGLVGLRRRRGVAGDRSPELRQATADELGAA